jgi:hypothetical protein
LADDLIRCGQLEGMTRRQVRRLLGSPDERDRRSFSWEVGPERDSFFRIDSEYFEVSFDREGRFRRASFYQG